MRMGVRLTSFSLSAGIDWPFCVIAQVPLIRLQSEKDHWRGFARGMEKMEGAGGALLEKLCHFFADMEKSD